MPDIPEVAVLVLAIGAGLALRAESLNRTKEEEDHNSEDRHEDTNILVLSERKDVAPVYKRKDILDIHHIVRVTRI